MLKLAVAGSVHSRFFVLRIAGLARCPCRYGKSAGEPTFDSVRASAIGARDYFLARTGAPFTDLTLLGRSLGGGVTSYIVSATAGDPRALILQSTFASLRETAANGFPLVRWLIERVYSIDFDSEHWNDSDAAVPSPVDSGCASCFCFGPGEKFLSGYPNCLFQYHGDDDDTVPYDQGKQLFDVVSRTSDPSCTEFFTQPGFGHDNAMGPAEQAATAAFANANARDP